MSQGNSAGFVRVMRSHDYNQFEVCLPIPEGVTSHFGKIQTSLVVQSVDDLRKEAARLVDKAVHQYDQMKRALALAEKLSGDDGLKLDQDYAETMNVPQEKWTLAMKAVAATVRQKEWLKSLEGRYDYEDDAPEFDDNDHVF